MLRLTLSSPFFALAYLIYCTGPVDKINFRLSERIIVAILLDELWAPTSLALVACAAALAVLEVIEQEDLLSRALDIGWQFNTHLNALKKEYPQIILDVRNKGAMIALELVHNGDAEQPNSELTQAIIANAAESGLILLACGFYGNVIRFLPALTADKSVVAEGLEAFSRLFKGLVDASSD